MPMEPHCQFTAKDFSLLEAMLEGCRQRDGALAALLRRKLKSATVVYRDDIRANVVTLNSRVVYRAGNQPFGPHLIVQEAHANRSGQISIQTLRGLGLLGLAEGQRITVDRDGNGLETLIVDRLVFQPQAELRLTRDRQLAKQPPPAGPDQEGSRRR